MSERRKVFELFEAQKDYVADRVRSGIEQYRKGYADITVKDSAGNVIPGARVKVTQKSHEFKFGANLFMLDEMETAEKNEAYKSRFADLFNMATLPFYWEATEPQKGHTRYAKDSEKLYRRPPIDLCIEFCRQHGIEPREHALAYEHFVPQWLYGATVAETKQAMEQRYREIAERYADKIPTIEVTNEMSWGLDRGRTAFYDAPDYVEWCFKLAEKYFPANQLVINEATRHPWGDNCRPTDKYYAYIEANLLKSARIDAIGSQFHMFFRRENEYENTRYFYNPELLYRHMDLYANFGKPLQVTEVTIPSYSWEPEDEELQADIIENLYSIWFSHPNMEQIVYWNLVDGYAHLADPDPEKIKASQGNMTLGENYYHGGLLRYDMSPKPAYYRMKDLIQKKWHTEEQLESNRNGIARFKGFYGTYDVEIEYQGKKVNREIRLASKGVNRFDAVIEL